MEVVGFDKTKILIMKKIIMLSALILCVCVAGFANGSHHSPKKKSVPAPVKVEQKKVPAYLDCYINVDFPETCCDGRVMITGFGVITYDCMSGEISDISTFDDPDGCGYACI